MSVHPPCPPLGPRYRTEGVLGAGAMAVVYAGVDTTSERPVAIKVLRAEVTGYATDLRFLREARLEAALRHPRIVSVLDTGTAEGRLFSVMPRLEGETLRDRLKREVQLPLAQVTAIVSEVAEALDHAHAHGVVHRDVKPENVMLTPEGAVLMDLGIAHALDVDSNDRVTLTGIAIGTPHYMSPEQAVADRNVDARTDVYALGCIAYEMLAGEPPFTAATPSAIRARHALEPVPSLIVVRPELPQAVDVAVHAALAKSPADRTPSAGAFARAFREAAALPPRSRVAPVNVGRRVALAALAAIALMAAAFAWRQRDPVPLRPTWVLVGSIGAPESEPGLGAAIREMITAELQRSPAVAVVPPEQVRIASRAAGLADTVPLTLARAREVALRTAVRAVVGGDVRRLSPTVLSVSLAAVEADSGRELVRRTRTVAADGSDLGATIGEMTRALRRQLGEQSDSLRSDRIPQLVQTSSFDAFRLYADALDAQRRGNFDGAIHGLRRAVATDTAFASAWALLAMTYVAVRQPDSARAAFVQAQRHELLLAPAERDRLRGDAAYNIEHDLAAAANAYQRFLEQRPASLGGWNNLGLYLSGLGRHEAALDAFARAMEIDPLVVGPRQIQLLNMGAELVVLGKRDSARVLLGRLQGPLASYLRLLLLNAENDWASLAREAAAVADAATVERFLRVPAQTHAAGALAALGDVEAADRRLADAIAGAHGADQRAHLHARLLLDLAQRRTTAWPLPPEVAADTSAGAELLRGVHAALAGDLARAERASRGIDARGLAVRRDLGAGCEYLAALIALQRARWDAAARIVPIAEAGEHDPLSVDRPSSVEMRLLAATILDAQGREAEAARMRDLMRRAERQPPAHFALRGFVMRSP